MILTRSHIAIWVCGIGFIVAVPGGAQGQSLGIGSDFKAPVAPAANPPVVASKAPTLPVSSSVLKQIVISNTDGVQMLKLITGVGVPEYHVEEAQNPWRLVIDLMNTKPKKGLAKKRAWQHVGSIRVGVHADKTRIVVDVKDQKQIPYQIEKNDSAIVLTLQQPAKVPVVVKTTEQPSESSSVPLAAVPEEAPKPVAAQPASKAVTIDNHPITDRISIDLRNADIRNVLQFIGESAGVNIVASDGVKGFVTMRLKDVYWRDALVAIVQMKGLGLVDSGGIIRVMPVSELKQEQVNAASALQLAQDSMPLVTRLIPINYADAKNLVGQLKELVSSRGKVSYDERTNMIVVTDVEANAQKIDQLIASLDTETPQVLIEARMVEASTSFTRSMGIQWGGGFGLTGAGANPTGIGFGATAGANNYAINVPATNPTMALGVTLGTVANLAALNARISAGEVNGQAKTVSQPKIMTLDNKTAKITQGYQIPVTVANINMIQTHFFNAGLELEVTPHVTTSNTVMMALKITNNQPDFTNKNTLDIPAILTKEATTQLLVKDGETAVIGGIFTKSTTKENKGTPFLSKIPVLGWLFKNQNDVDEQREMIVFLTPRVIKHVAAEPQPL